MSSRNGWEEQLSSLRKLAARHGGDTVVLRDPLNLSWFTGARWHVPQTLNLSCFDVVVSGLAGGTDDAQVRIVTNAIEAPRLRDTEFADRDVEFQIVEWTQDRTTLLPSGESVLVDQANPTSINAQEEITALRRILNPRQQDTLSQLGADLARITGQTVAGVRPGDTEHHVAGVLITALLDEGIETVAAFVGGDERISKHRHPLATSRPVRQRVMVACCGRREGMVGTVTRMGSFVPLGQDAEKYRSLLEVERTFLDHSRPGAVLGDVLRQGAASYPANGFEHDEWRRHHQGGLTGFSPRELIATPATDLVLANGMALGWNPSAAGFKVEDTVLVTDHGPHILSFDPQWPSLDVGGRPRPAVLEIP